MAHSYCIVFFDVGALFTLANAHQQLRANWRAQRCKALPESERTNICDNYMSELFITNAKRWQADAHVNRNVRHDQAKWLLDEAGNDSEKLSGFFVTFILEILCFIDASTALFGKVN